ncbi:PucR family transcriptional regulator [Paeniglutamicibacter psychrophenolicus]|uniref:PucR family transcriptional regulator n=1 Tax=Paeniglutamicibacter psychrophenolicus TaxID=257454 RepID=UPI00278A7661|nr:PucR family transcriptional regulator [Paeniglutamicibacter psychrophenolicus]MDQ0092317.1 purine catabolism regulator [Paeniglutamicibacter psychrophenolicus]
MISLLQMGAELGPELVPAPGAQFSANPVTGVHVSELEDPTPYLEGGELLLTTGMPFAKSAALSAAYMARLGEREVRAVGLGLGPWLTEVPAHVLAASQAAGIELAIVPDGVPFQHVSRAYWRLSARDDTANLMDSLGTQTALARAAMRPDATNAVVRGLAQALGGWAAYLPADAGTETVWPVSAVSLVGLLRAESIRFHKAGVPSAATFEVQGQPVVLYPILLGSRIHGFLCIGSGRTLTRADRQVIMTVSTLLALRARQREVVIGTTNALGAATTKLLLHGQTEAAHMVAEDVGLAELPTRVRLLGIRLSDGDDPGLAARAAAKLVADPGLPDLSAAVDACTLRHAQDGILYLVLPASGIGSRPADGGGRSLEQDALLGIAGAAEPEAFGSLAAALGDPVSLGEIPGNLAVLRRAVLQAPAGHLVAVDASEDAKAVGWVRALAEYPRADLLATVRAYLGARGTWEDAARALGIHRNSLRHRISVASGLLGVDLDDPDVAAHLWLAMRREESGVQLRHVP